MTEIKTKLVDVKSAGEIFDSSLEKCPVCNAGPEFLSLWKIPVLDFQLILSSAILFWDRSCGGKRRYKPIEKRDATGNILILSEEEVLPYNRPMLTKNMFQRAAAG